MKQSTANVLAALEHHHSHACTYELRRWMEATGRWAGSDSIPKRVCELLDDGYSIDRSRMCDRHPHQARMYRLERNPTQMSLTEGNAVHVCERGHEECCPTHTGGPCTLELANA